MWHRHTWEEVGRAWTGQVQIKNSGAAMSEHLAERLLFGVTVIDLRCAVCGDRKSVELLGQHVTLAARPPGSIHPSGGDRA